MNVVKQDFRKKIILDLFCFSDEPIEEIYFQIAEHVLITLYKANPFHSLFEGFKWDNIPNDFFQSCLCSWASAFKIWELNDMGRASTTVFSLISHGIIPSLGMFKCVYDGNELPVAYEKNNEYHMYLRQHSTYQGNFDMIINGAKTYEGWHKEKYGTIPT
jgi:hypothetical protein